MKKIILSVIGSSLIFGIGTVVMAAGNNADNDTTSFENMKPFMEKMHPDFTNEQLKDMYDSCHGDNGMMKNQEMKNMENMNPKNIMNHF